MVRSMTGFGRGEASDERHRFTAEVRAVNHRYLDITIRMPRKLNLFESKIRTLMKQYTGRGKVDLTITAEDLSGDDRALRYQESVARQYLEYCRQMSEDLGIENDMTVSKLAAMPDVFVMQEDEGEEESLWPLLSQALMQAGEALAAQKAAEGQRLADDILGKLAGMEEAVARIEERSPETVREYQMKLIGKIQELLGDETVDESRILTEAAIYADKVCVDEETVRLKSHIHQMKDTLTGTGEGAGRKLDFLAQEMNREANTTLSKCSDMESSSIAISLKTEIEKIREQVQNIE